MLNDADREKLEAIQSRLADEDPRWARSFCADTRGLRESSNDALRTSGYVLGIVFGTLLAIMLLIFGAVGAAIPALLVPAALIWWMRRHPD